MNAKIYNLSGKETGTIELPEKVFAAPKRRDLVHQVVVSMQSNARANTAHTKDRSEVSGTNQKPWRQKGTGRARHGQRISPIWRGGGIAHGPTNERNYTKKINKHMRAEALYSVLSQKLAAGEILFVDSLAFSEPKTAQAKKTLLTLAGVEGFEMLATKRNNAALLALTGRSHEVELSFRNIGSVFVEEVRNLNPVEVLRYKYLVIADPTLAVEQLQKRSKKGEKAAGKTKNKIKKSVTEKKPGREAAKKSAKKATAKPDKQSDQQSDKKDAKNDTKKSVKNVTTK